MRNEGEERVSDEPRVTTLKVVVGTKPNELVIELLREALRDAKMGKIQGVGLATACVSSDPDSDMGRCTETIISFTDGWAHVTSAAVSTLWMRLHYERYVQGSVLPDPKLEPEDE